MSSHPGYAPCQAHYFEYPPLPPQPNTTRMIRLFPHEDKTAPIECEIFNYDLSEVGHGVHVYEALSYVWGSEVRVQLILVNGGILPVTRNLHAALLHLRNHRLERTLWVDAISIDQGNTEEKNKQIPLMRTIYAQAQQVVVWLGEAIQDGDRAIEEIRCLAGDQDASSGVEKYHDACLSLLERDWFQRIWVLQEVGVARCISVMCSSTQINGHIFCEGLSRLDLPASLRSKINPVAFLMKGALYRPKARMDSPGNLPIGQLIGMYQNHKVTKPHDKLYALLGLSADSTAAALAPDYDLRWEDVFKRLAYYIFPESSVETWDGVDSALIQGKGWVIGYIYSVEETISEYGRQKFKVCCNEAATSLGLERWEDDDWGFQSPGELIQDADMICLLRGASKPSIVRPCKDHFIIITPTVTPPQRQPGNSPENRPTHQSMNYLQDLLLIWTIPQSDTASVHTSMAPKYGEEQSEARKRQTIITLYMADLAAKLLQQKTFQAKAISNVLYGCGTVERTARRLVEFAAKDDLPQYNATVPSESKDSITAATERISQALLCHDLSFSEELIAAVLESSGPLAYIVMEIFLQRQGNTMSISSESVRAAAKNIGMRGYIPLEILLQHRGNRLPVTTDVIETAAGNTGPCGDKILDLLVRHQRGSFSVSTGVIRAAAGNTGPYGLKIVDLLLQHQGVGVPVSTEVITAAAGNAGPFGHRITKTLLQHVGEAVAVTEEAITVAAGDAHSGDGAMMKLLLQHHRGKKLVVSEAMVMAAAENTGPHATNFLKFLIDNQGGDSLPFTAKVIKAAVGNSGSHAHKITRFVLKYLEHDSPLMEELIKVAAANPGRRAYNIIELLQNHGTGFPLSAEVLRIAAGNTTQASKIMHQFLQLPHCEGPIFDLLSQYHKSSFAICEGFLTALASYSRPRGIEIMELVLQHGGEGLSVTEEIVMAAARNTGNGPDMMRLFIRYLGKNLPVTEGVVESAARNYQHTRELLQLLIELRGQDLPVTVRALNLIRREDGGDEIERLLKANGLLKG